MQAYSREPYNINIFNSIKKYLFTHVDTLQFVINTYMYIHMYGCQFVDSCTSLCQSVA